MVRLTHHFFNKYYKLSNSLFLDCDKSYADANNKTFVTYESEKSLQAKCEYVMSKGVKGIMWWDYGSDSTGTLITALNSYLSILNK